MALLSVEEIGTIFDSARLLPRVTQMKDAEIRSVFRCPKHSACPFRI